MDERKEMTQLIMLCGFPGSGKSTVIKDLLVKYPDAFVYSVDAKIMEMAKKQDKNYSEMFDKFKDAKKSVDVQLHKAIKNNQIVIWDQTNLTEKSRFKKMNQFPNSYKRELIHLVADPETLKERLEQRTEQPVPWKVVENMMEIYEKPTLDEGFTSIITIDTTSSSSDDNTA